jgi:hypothetical protein
MNHAPDLLASGPFGPKARLVRPSGEHSARTRPGGAFAELRAISSDEEADRLLSNFIIAIKHLMAT